MLLKNKIYSAIIIVIFIICSIIGLNENIIGNPLGKKVFYLLGFLFFVLLIIGTTKKEDINAFFFLFVLIISLYKNTNTIWCKCFYITISGYYLSHYFFARKNP